MNINRIVYLIEERYKLIYLSFFLCLSCINDKETHIDVIKGNGIKIENNYSGFILIIPNLVGCSDCYNDGINFCKKNLEKKHIYFIITSDLDFKKTKQNFNDEEILSKNLVFDVKMKTKINNLQSSSLILIKVKDGNEVEKEELNPENISEKLAFVQKQLK